MAIKIKAKSSETFEFEPVKIGDEEYSSITVRQPTFQEKYGPQADWPITGPSMKQLQNYQVSLGSKLTNLPAEVYGQLPAEVIEAVQDFFLPQARK